MITSINYQVYHEYPEFGGIDPTIQDQGDNFLFIYKKKVSLGQGKILNRSLRLVVNPTGNIVKISTSR